MSGYRFTERHVAGWIAVAQKIERRVAPLAGNDARPEFERELVDGGESRAEGGRRADARGGDGGGDELRSTARGATAARYALGWRQCGAGAEGLVREGARDVGSGADLPLQVALGEELVKGRHDRVAGDAELAGHRASRGEARASWQAAGKDGQPDTVIKLTVQWFLRIRIEGECRRDAFGDHVGVSMGQ